jgi:flagellar biosynthesis/type III secretory pathway protein FliH
MDKVHPIEPEKLANQQAPLGDTEISSLIQAASKASYQPVAAYGRPKDVSFRKHNLVEIARAAKPLPTATVAENFEKTTLESDISDTEALNMEVQDSSAGSSDNPSDHPVDPEAEIEPVIDAALVAAEINAAEERATKAAEDKGALLLEAAEKLAYEKGFQAGIDSVSSNVEQEMAKALVVMEAAGKAFITPPLEAATELRHAMEQTLLAMASVRAGSQIDAVPASFLRRIEMMADRVQSIATRPILRLHPADLAAIGPLITGSEIMSQARLLANPDLARGDVDLSLGGVRLADILGPIPNELESQPPDEYPSEPQKTLVVSDPVPQVSPKEDPFFDQDTSE